MHLEEQEIKRKQELDRKDQIMQARLQKMKEEVVDKQNLKEKQEEKKMLKAVLAKEKKEENKEKDDVIKLKRHQMHFREYLAKQIQEKNQVKKLEKEKNNVFIREVLDKDAREQKEERGKALI